MLSPVWLSGNKYAIMKTVQPANGKYGNMRLF